ncbi:MAG: hypothetical protein FJ264_12185 [Planctomycetes bacterium]|nr:hypothetical protein [Planctomycetota bacterium]
MYKKVIFALGILPFLLFNSCAQSPALRDEIHLFATPFKLNVHSGSVNNGFVEALDKQGSPISGLKIKVFSAFPSVATVKPEDIITDTQGKAAVSIYGISPGGTKIIFSVDGEEASIDVVFSEH